MAMKKADEGLWQPRIRGEAAYVRDAEWEQRIFRENKIKAARQGVVPNLTKNFRFLTQRIEGPLGKKGALRAQGKNLSALFYGHAIAGAGWSVETGIGAGDAVVAVSDAATGISGLMRLPRFEDQASAAEATAHAFNRFSDALINVYVPVERLRAGMLFVAGQKDARSALAVPPADVLGVLSAAMHIGIEPSVVKMIAPEEGALLRFLPAEHLLARADGRRLLSIPEEKRPEFTASLLDGAREFLDSPALRAKRKLAQRETVSAFHLQLASALWWSSPSLFSQKLGEMEKIFRSNQGQSLDRELIKRYRLMHTYMRRSERGARGNLLVRKAVPPVASTPRPAAVVRPATAIMTKPL